MSTRVGINFALSYEIPSRSSSFCQSDVVVVQEDDIKRMNEHKDKCDVINDENGEVGKFPPFYQFSCVFFPYNLTFTICYHKL